MRKAVTVSILYVAAFSHLSVNKGFRECHKDVCKHASLAHSSMSKYFLSCAFTLYVGLSPKLHRQTMSIVSQNFTFK